MQSETQPTRVLFTGYAPVHFACFGPLYQRLRALGSSVRITLSGGLRSRESRSEAYQYDEQALYNQFAGQIDLDHVQPVDAIRDESYDVLFAANTKMIMPKHVSCRVQIFHGISFRNKAVRGDNAGADAYFLVGPYMKHRFAEAGHLAADDPRALHIGFMKTDRLVDGTLDRRDVLERYGFTGERPVVLYAPTGQRHNSLETMGEDVIRALTERNQVDLLIKPHDHPKNKKINWPERLAAIETGHTRLARDADVIPLLHAADLLITDASSVSSEYALLDRPIVFLDVPKLIKRALAANDAMVDLQTWGRRCGMVVEQPADVVQTVEQALIDQGECSDVRHAMTADLFYNPGRATQAAMDWFKKDRPAVSVKTAGNEDEHVIEGEDSVCANESSPAGQSVESRRAAV
ncbi:MAG: hypothetical protein D8M59_03455 [Planctomycetes bacterium]|nr:hypothetical protein [Planctomycetota bacterium]NOG53053.1 hypothetical protein [Planctomycetota bacterium]